MAPKGRDMNDDILHLGNDEIVELTPAFWQDSERLARTARKLKALAAAPPRYRLEPVEHEPELPPPRPNLADQLHRRIDEDVEADNAAMRTAIARGQIESALREEAEQQRQSQERQQAEARAAFRATGIGKLLSRRI
jgi:hypothetical protein